MKVDSISIPHKDEVQAIRKFVNFIDNDKENAYGRTIKLYMTVLILDKKTKSTMSEKMIHVACNSPRMVCSD
jgi:hypothetical protein